MKTPRVRILSMVRGGWGRGEGGERRDDAQKAEGVHAAVRGIMGINVLGIM